MTVTRAHLNAASFAARYGISGQQLQRFLSQPIRAGKSLVLDQINEAPDFESDGTAYDLKMLEKSHERNVAQLFAYRALYGKRLDRSSHVFSAPYKGHVPLEEKEYGLYDMPPRRTTMYYQVQSAVAAM